MTELVTVKIDGKELRVPKGMNLIEVGKLAGIDIPHYCYHPDLSIAGNCRMCQVELKGSPKLVIACNTTATDGMEIATHHTSERVKQTQEANLEFILKNHPLDCTVCDQSGHCKLQDYYFEYSRRESRLLETKVKKKKAFQIGPHVVLDAERCILCTRCVRFLDEVTKTGELGVVNRGDKSEIDLFPGKWLDNPLSATVIDLCPVGALTYADWRFKSRIWFTKRVDTLCVGCSRNCNVTVHHRDGEIVTVKARYNKQVNKEWLCDEGRFGFNRFKPLRRVKFDSEHESVLKKFKELITSGEPVLGIVSAFLTVEDILSIQAISNRYPNLVLQGLVIKRGLSEVERVLVKPDYSPNKEAFDRLGINHYPGKPDLVSFQAAYSVGFGLTTFEVERVELPQLRFLMTGYGELQHLTEYLIPTKYVYEKNGHMINSDGILQPIKPIFHSSNRSEWELLRVVFEEVRAVDIENRLEENLGQFTVSAGD